MAKLESFATLNISDFQQKLKNMETAINAAEKNISKNKFEVTVSVNSKALESLGKVSFDRISNSFKALESVMKKVAGINFKDSGIFKLSSLANIDLSRFGNEVLSLSKALANLKANNFTFNIKGFESISKIDLSNFIRQITNLNVATKGISGFNFNINTAGLEKISKLQLSEGIKQIVNLNVATKGITGFNFKADLRGLDQLSKLRFEEVNKQLPALAQALKTLQGVGNVNLDIKSLRDLAKLDIEKVKKALNELVPTLQKLNNINIRINLPTGTANQLNTLGNNFNNYGNFARSFAASLGLISPQMSSMFYWTGRVAEGLGLYNTTTTLARFNTIALVGAIGTVVAVMATLGVVAVEQGRKFQDAFAVLEANGVKNLDAVKSSLEDIRNTDLSTARRGLADYGQALADLTRAGQTGAEGLTILKQAAFLATAEGTDLSSTAIELTRNLLQFGLTANSAARAANALTLASNDAVGTQSDLSRGLNVVGVVAKSAGFSLEETLAVLVELDNKGLSAADKGATALRNILAAASSPTVAFRNAAKGLGVDLADAAGKTRSARDVILDLVKALNAGGVSYNELTGEITASADKVAAASQLFRTRGFAAILSLSDGVLGLADNYKKGGTAAEDFAKILSNTLTGELQRLQSTVKDAGTELFQLIGPSLIAGLKGATGAIEGLRDGFNAINDSKELIGSILALGAGLLILQKSTVITTAALVGFNTVVALLTPIGQAGVLALTGFNTAFNRLSTGAKLAAIAVGLFQKASLALTVANPIGLAITTSVLALGTALVFATKAYNDLEAAADKSIKKNLDFLESLKKAQAEGRKVSPELGVLRGQEFVRQASVQNAINDPNSNIADVKRLAGQLAETRKNIQKELNKFKTEKITVFSVSDEAQKSLDALNERADSLRIRFQGLKDVALDKTFLDINAGIRELIKGLDDIPEISGNAGAYKAAVDRFKSVQNELQNAAIEQSINDGKQKNADDFGDIEKQKTALLKDEAKKRKLELEQELKDIDTKYKKELELAQRNLRAAQSNKNANPAQLASLQGVVAQTQDNQKQAREAATQRGIEDQKVIAQTKLDKERDLQDKILALRQSSAQKSSDLLKIQSSVVERSYQQELEGAKENIAQKIAIDEKYRQRILDNTKKQILSQLNLDRAAAQQTRDQAIRDAQKVTDPKIQNQLINLAKGNYTQEAANLQLKATEDFKTSQIAFDKQVADHRRELAETYYKFKLTQDRAVYENETRLLDTLNAKQLSALRERFEKEAAYQKSIGNTRSADLANEFAKKAKDQQINNQDALTKKTPEITNSVSEISRDLNNAINKQETSLDRVKVAASEKYLTIVQKAKDELKSLKEIIDKAGVANPNQLALIKQLESLIKLGDAKAGQAVSQAVNQFNRGLNDTASNRNLELATRTYDANLDAVSYDKALKAYEEYWQKRLEIAKKNADPVERASQVATAQDNINAAQQKRVDLQKQQNSLLEAAIKLENDILQNKIDQTDDEQQKIVYSDALLSRLKDQLELARQAVSSSTTEKGRIENATKELELEKQVQSAVQQRIRLEQDAYAKQKEAIQNLIALKQSELDLQQKQADNDDKVIEAYDARIKASTRSTSIQKSQLDYLTQARDKVQQELNSTPRNDPGRADLYEYRRQLNQQITQGQTSLNAEISNGLDLQKGKQQEIVGFVQDELQTREAVLKAYNSILGKSGDVVQNAKAELELAKLQTKAVEDQIRARGDAGKSNDQLATSSQGRAEIRDRAAALQKEVEARRAVATAEFQQANEGIDRETKRKKLILEIAQLDNAEVESARIDVAAEESKLNILAEQIKKSEDLVSFDKLSRQYADDELQLQKDKVKLKELEANIKFKSASDQNNRDLQLAQAQLQVSEEAGNQVLALSQTIAANIRQLDILRNRRQDLKPGSDAFKDNEVAIAQKEASIAEDVRQKNVAISDQKRTHIELLGTQLNFENRLRGYGQDSVQYADAQIKASESLVDVLKSQIAGTTDRITKENLLKQLYSEQLNLLDAQDQKAKTIADNRKLSIDEAASAKSLNLVASKSNTPVNIAKINIQSDADLVAILNEQLAATTDINERTRLRTQINQTLQKQYEDQNELASAQVDSLQSTIDLQYARTQVMLLQAGYADDGVEAANAQLRKDQEDLRILEQRLSLSVNEEESKKVQLDIANQTLKIEKDKIAVIKAQAEQRKLDIDLQASVNKLQDSLSNQFVTKSVAAQRAIRDAELNLNKAQTDQGSATNDKEKEQAQIGVNNALADLAEKRRGLIQAQNEEFLTQKEQLKDIAQAQQALNDAISGADQDNIRSAEAKLRADRQDLSVLEQRLRLAEGEEAKNSARVAILQKQAQIEKDLDGIAQARLDREQQLVQISQARQALNDAISGADQDNIRSAEAKLRADRQDLSVLEQRLRLAEGEEAKNDAKLSILQKQVQIQKDLDAIQEASYNRQLSLVELTKSQTSVLQKQGQLALTKANAESDPVATAQFEAAVARGTQSDIAAQILVVSGKVVKSLDEQIDKNKQLNDLQGQYLDAQNQELLAEKKVGAALREQETLRSRLQDAVRNVSLAADARPVGDVAIALQNVDSANKNLQRSLQDSNQAVRQLGSGFAPLSEEVGNVISAFDGTTQSIEAQRSALESLAAAYENQISGAISLAGAVRSAQQVFSKDFGKLNSDELKKLLDSSTQQRDQLAGRLEILLKNQNTSSSQLSAALSDLSGAEKDRQGFLEQFQKASKGTVFKFRAELDKNAYNLPGDLITRAGSEISKITENTAKAESARQEANQNAQVGLSASMDTFTKTFSSANLLTNSLNRFVDNAEGKNLNPENDPQVRNSIENPININQLISNLPENLASEYNNKILSVFAKQQEAIANTKNAELDSTVRQRSLESEIDAVNAFNEATKAQNDILIQQATIDKKILEAKEKYAEIIGEQNGQEALFNANTAKELARQANLNAETKGKLLVEAENREIKAREALAAQLEEQAIVTKKSARERESIEVARLNAQKNIVAESAYAAYLQNQFDQETLKSRIATEATNLELARANVKIAEANAEAAKSSAYEASAEAGNVYKRIEIENQRLEAIKKQAEEALKAQEIQTQILKKQLENLDKQKGDYAPIYKALEELLKSQTSFTSEGLKYISSYLDTLKDALSKLEIKVPPISVKIPEPQFVVPSFNQPKNNPGPSAPERSLNPDNRTYKTINFNFGDITQNVTTQSVSPDDIGRIFRNIKVLIQNEAENLGKGC